MGRLAGGVAFASQSMMVRLRTKLVAPRYTVVCAFQAALDRASAIAFVARVAGTDAFRHHVASDETDKMEFVS